ncbi:MAG: hypothetical protein IKE17_16075 [Clostridia bacterium]|nr:hypothetical protein [Clostridia bacterium]MBR2799238.1 hypothetical protein [Clostridia bacterium]
MNMLGLSSKRRPDQITASEDHNYISEFAVIILFLILSFVFLFESPLHPWINGESGTDSSVFRTIAMMMKHGNMPYRDTFDHKGPLMYIICYLGLTISESSGIWAIEFLNLFITFLLLYKTAKIWTHNKWQAIICVLAGSTILFEYFEGGNLVEEYSMPYISAALFIFSDYMINNRYSKMRLTICGFCLGCVIMLRVNMAVVWVVFCITIFFQTIIRKEFDKVALFIIWFTIGVAISVLPILLWLVANNSLSNFWKAYIKFNFLYSSAEGGRASFPSRWNAFFTFTNTFIFTLSLTSSLFLFVKKKNNMYALLTANLLCSVFMMTISGQTYPHYGMILVPLFVAAIASLFSYLNIDKNVGGVASVLTMGFLICYLIAGKWESELQKTASIYGDKGNRHISDQTMQISEKIQEWTSEDEKISVYGNYDVLYIESQRSHATQYSYQFPIGTIDSGIMNDYWKQMQDEKPAVFVVTKGKCRDVQKYVEENDYCLVWSSGAVLDDSNLIYWKSDSLKKEGILLDLCNNPCVELSHAELSENQHEGTAGVICHGSLRRDYAVGMALVDYLLNEDYIGLKYTIEDVSDVEILSFYGKKTKDHGHPSVYIYDDDGNMVRKCTDNYRDIDDSWKRYYISLKGLKGKCTIVFNGGYTDDTGSEDSEYVFSDIRLYK